MNGQFHLRLRDYYNKLAEVLKGKADAASIFPNPSDLGSSREQIYAEFLRLHLPPNSNILFGGYLFGMDGSESRQMNVIVTCDSSPQYNFFQSIGIGKLFSCIEGTIAVASIKSNLDSKNLINALENIASLPNKEILIPKKLIMNFDFFDYDDWPFKIIYAYDGLSRDTLQEKMIDFYEANPQIPSNKRPNLIHIAGKYHVIRNRPNMNMLDKEGNPMPNDSFGFDLKDPDVGALAYSIWSIQEMAFQSRFIIFNYNHILNALWKQIYPNSQ